MQTVSYAERACRLTDLESLALLSPAGERCAQWSSFHRDRRYDKATDKYVAWDQNGDQTGAIRGEGDQLVLAEMDGPGCIVRIWSASPQDGRLKIYRDGAETPAVDLPLTMRIRIIPVQATVRTRYAAAVTNVVAER